MLIGFRALAGLGGGGILNNVMVIISDIVSLRERGKVRLRWSKINHTNRKHSGKDLLV